MYTPPMSKYQTFAPKPAISGILKAAAFIASPLLPLLSYESRKVHIPALHKLRYGNQFYFMKENHWTGRLMNSSSRLTAAESW